VPVAPDAFAELTGSYRAELLAHCYRILGSVADAEDVLQETMVAAWKGLERFEGRASVRSWLYRIATNRSLNHLRALDRRPRTAAAPLGRLPTPTRLVESSSVQPCPDSLLDGIPEPGPGPEARYESAEAISLAFVTALQLLAPRQRAALVLRDVLGMRASEAAEILECSEGAVTSMLARARATLRSAAPDRNHVRAEDSPARRAVVDDFAAAFEAGDMRGMVALLTEDVRLTMPPAPLEYQGRRVVAEFIAAVCHTAAHPGWRLIATTANGQPAFGCYLRDRHGGIAHAHGLLVLDTLRTATGVRVDGITRFLDNSCLPGFGLPRTVPVALPGGRS
jgi:RNA polymerase sigma-70 factor (TIGR02960 family)